MNLKEHAVLDAINQAGWVRRDYWVTANEIVTELRRAGVLYDYLEDARRVLGKVNARDIGYLLRRMALDPRFCIRGQTLVEKRRVRGTNQWRATREAMTAVCV